MVDDFFNALRFMRNINQHQADHGADKGNSRKNHHPSHRKLTFFLHVTLHFPTASGRRNTLRGAATLRSCRD